MDYNNSVKEIISASNKIIDECIESEFNDIKALSKTLSKQLDELNDYFTKHPDDTNAVNELKHNANHTALCLETIANLRLGLFKETVEMRKFASKLYVDCRDATRLAIIHDVDNKSIIWERGADTQWALSFYSRSLRVAFSITKSDEEKIKEIVSRLTEVS